jgi:hypothetical protein
MAQLFARQTKHENGCPILEASLSLAARVGKQDPLPTNRQNIRTRRPEGAGAFMPLKKAPAIAGFSPGRAESNLTPLNPSAGTSLFFTPASTEVFLNTSKKVGKVPDSGRRISSEGVQVMSDNRKLVISEVCRVLGKRSLNRRREFAETFVKRLFEAPAPPKEVDDRDEAWTRWIRTRLIEICPKDCYALPDDPSTVKGEYLVDYTWAEEEIGKRVLLACESEWGTGWFGSTNWYRVEHDFEKLLAVKAPFKVLMFSSCCEPGKSRPGQETNFSLEYAQRRLRTSLANYWHHIPGEFYIFIDLPQTGKQGDDGVYTSFFWSAEKFGKANEVEFEVGWKDKLARP